MIFLCFEEHVKVPWFSGFNTQVYFIRSLSFRHHLQDLFTLHRLTIKAFHMFSGSFKLMTSQVEEDACSFLECIGRIRHQLKGTGNA